MIATLFSEDGKIAAELDRGKMYQNDALVSYVKRPDPSTLVVVNTHGETLLTVHYLNQRALSIKGTFYKPFSDVSSQGAMKVTISADKVIFPRNNTFSGNCTSGITGSVLVF